MIIPKFELLIKAIKAIIIPQFSINVPLFMHNAYIIQILKRFAWTIQWIDNEKLLFNERKSFAFQKKENINAFVDGLGTADFN